MNGRRSKEIRKAANEAATQTGRQAGAVVGGVLEYARRIELVTDHLQDEVDRLWPATHANTALRNRTLTGRLRWLLTGR